MPGAGGASAIGSRSVRPDVTQRAIGAQSSAAPGTPASFVMGVYMDVLWSIHGCVVEYTWMCCGVYMDVLWSLHDPLLGCSVLLRVKKGCG
jgi:hypothetical protein